jgi:hypothetical protein
MPGRNHPRPGGTAVTKAHCPFCLKIVDCEQVSGRRGPDRAWVRLQCSNCRETFEHHTIDHKLPETEADQKRREVEAIKAHSQELYDKFEELQCYGPRHDVPIWPEEK